MESPEPSLAPPGAGLPQPELSIARLLVWWGCWRTNRARSAAQFARERDAVLTLAQGCAPEWAERRVLIKRLPGQEDSSRFWSIYMTVEHLRIVNQGIGEVIGQLARGVLPGRKTSTADAKPRRDVGEAAIEEFERVCARFEETVAGVGELRTEAKHPHPWFGPMDAGRLVLHGGLPHGVAPRTDETDPGRLANGRLVGAGPDERGRQARMSRYTAGTYSPLRTGLLLTLSCKLASM